MKTSLLMLSLLTFSYSNLFGQTTEIKKVKYARTEIEVPASYYAKDEYSIENDLFSAQWLYLTKEMAEQGINKQIIEQFEGQLQYQKSTSVDFVSNGGQFSGKKYQLKGDGKLKFRILAFGSVDGQPLVLNLAFKDDPKSDEKLDDLMKKFIRFKKIKLPPKMSIVRPKELNCGGGEIGKNSISLGCDDFRKYDFWVRFKYREFGMAVLNEYYSSEYNLINCGQ